MSDAQPEKHAEYSHVPLTDDPTPPGNGACLEQLDQYKDQLEIYSREKLIAFKEVESIQGEEMWRRFKTTFRKDSLNWLCHDSLLYWRSLLLTKGVHVRRVKGEPVADALIECLSSEVFIPSGTGQKASQDIANIQKSGSGSTLPTDEGRSEQAGEVSYRKIGTEQPLVGQDTKTANHFAASEPPPANSTADTHSVAKCSSLGISGLIDFYSNRPRYSGGPFEDLYGIAEVYRTLADLCDLADEDMARFMPLMLEGDAMMFFCRKLKGMRAFDKVVEALWEEFTPESLRFQLLRIWQTTSLMEHMKKNPQKSELEVFKDFCRFLETTQRQLGKFYRCDIFLRDQILISTDIPELERAVWDPIPKDSQTAKRRIANLLSCAPGSARRYARRS